MHNLLLGSAKQVFECWIEKGILKEKDLEEISQLRRSPFCQLKVE